MIENHPIGNNENLNVDKITKILIYLIVSTLPEVIQQSIPKHLQAPDLSAGIEAPGCCKYVARKGLGSFFHLGQCIGAICSGGRPLKDGGQVFLDHKTIFRIIL